MSRPGFLEGVGVALAGSTAAALGLDALAALAPRAGAGAILVAGLALGYLVYLLVRAPGRTGRVSAIGLWVVVTATCAALDVTLGTLVVTQAALVWLVRSLLFQRGVLGAFADGALVALGLAAAVWACLSTASVFLAVWSGLLVQSLFSAIPGAAAREARRGCAARRFEQAARSAEAAVRRLSISA